MAKTGAFRHQPFALCPQAGFFQHPARSGQKNDPFKEFEDLREAGATLPERRSVFRYRLARLCSRGADSSGGADATLVGWCQRAARRPDLVGDRPNVRCDAQTAVETSLSSLAYD